MGLLAAAAAGISVHETELLVSFTLVELVAILMTLMELVVINVGYDLGVIPPNVFAMLVLMAIFSTVITAPVLRIGLRKLGWKYELRPDVRSPCRRDPFAIGARCAKKTALMKKLFVFALLIVAFAPFSAQSQQSSGTLAGFLSGQGLAGAKLERRFGNHLFVPVSINDKRAALMIDTGAPVTLIDKDSATTFGLKVENTARNVGGVFGGRWERYGMGMVKTIAMANCVLTNVPVALAEESSMNTDISSPPIGSHIPTLSRLPHINGLLGSREMRKFGMIIDCTRQMLYVNPNGPSAAVCEKLAAFLSRRGFTRVPMRLNSGNHFDVQGALNGHPTRFIVDTGSSTTLIDKKTAMQAGIGPSGTALVSDAGEGRIERIGSANVKELAIGGFTILNAETTVANISGEVLHSKTAPESNAGLIGAEYLAFNFAVIDVGGMALYLRHPDSR